MTERNRRQSLALAWFAEFEPRIRQALATRVNRRADIDDLVQEVYLRMLRIPEPDLVANPQAYLYRLAINVAGEWSQRAAQALDHSSDGLEDLTATESVEAHVVQMERKKALDRALASLPDNSRTALMLHASGGLTYEAIAEHMGTSRRAVKRYIANGYAQLRQHLTPLDEDGDENGETWEA